MAAGLLQPSGQPICRWNPTKGAPELRQRIAAPAEYCHLNREYIRALKSGTILLDAPIGGIPKDLPVRKYYWLGKIEMPKSGAVLAHIPLIEPLPRGSRPQGGVPLVSNSCTASAEALSVRKRPVPSTTTMNLPLRVAPEVCSGKVAEPCWSSLVARVQTGESAALEELYSIFAKRVRFVLLRQVGPQDIEDRIHDVFVIVAQSIQRGELREPDRLMGYIRTVLRRQVASYIERQMQARRHRSTADTHTLLPDRGKDPERILIERQNTDIALGLLRSIPPRDREVLVRFYLREQAPADICRDLDLSENQFRLIKSRAKARFGELGRHRFAPRRNAPRSAKRA